MSKRLQFPAPSPVYLGPPARTSPGSNKPIDRVVIHGTVSPCVEGGARATARYFASGSARGSAHYVIDPGEVVQCGYDSVICWHAPPNPRSIGLEMCCYPSPDLDDWRASDDDRRARTVAEGRESAGHEAPVRPLAWVKRDLRRMLRRTARLTAELCLAYDIPVVFLSPADLLADKRGITTHANVSAAWHQSTHWDPGVWPQRAFMTLVRLNVRRLRREARKAQGR